MTARVRLLAIDIDGTLLDSQGRLPDVNRRALADAIGCGIELALVTGRSFHFTKPVADLLDLPVTLIVNNGAVVKSAEGKTAMRHVLPRGVAREVLEQTADAYADSVALIFDRLDERQMIFEHMDWSHPQRSGYYEKNRAFIAASSCGLAEMLTEDPIQVMFNGGVDRMRALAAMLRAAPAGATYNVSVTEYQQKDFSLVDINGAGCSKGATLARWAATRGIPPEWVMAIGDNLNDIDMLKFAGTAVVMGNAVEEMKAFGYAVTGTNDEGGLAAAVKRCVTDTDR